MYLNEATLLNNLKIRYNKDKIYVSIFFRIVIDIYQFSCPVDFNILVW